MNGAVITVNGSSSGEVGIVEGENVIRVTVVALDGISRQEYTVIVTRSAAAQVVEAPPTGDSRSLLPGYIGMGAGVCAIVLSSLKRKKNNQ